MVFASAANAATYIVLYKEQSLGTGTSSVIARAGGSLVASYPEIGVVIAQSSSPSFRDGLLKDAGVEGVASTARFGIRVSDDLLTRARIAPSLTPGRAAASGDDTFSGLQWDMTQIHVPEAHAITTGSRSVLVGDIDTGLDPSNPDLAPNVDFANSVSCESGAPNQSPAAWDDPFGHGTHTAGTIAAAANGIGIVGVAPDVRISAIRSSNADGFFFPEMVVCSFMWAGTHHFDVTNNSYFADPFYFNCRNDPEQRAIWKAEQRAIRFAMNQGVTVVAALGNFSDDLAHPTQDIISPDTGPFPNPRDVTNACAEIPGEIPGVIGVSGVGNQGKKSFFSNYGSGDVQVTSPSGDDLQVTPAAPNGLVLSTMTQHESLLTQFLPVIEDCSVSPCARYMYLEGTSMAAPHVTGVAALIESRFGHMSPGAVQALIDQSADPIDCPTPTELLFYAPFPQFSNGLPQSCTGGRGYNSWYGHGQVNAVRAVSR